MKLRRVWVLGCAMLLLAGCSFELQHDLSEEDANEILVLLTENGISAEKKPMAGGEGNRFQIVVAKSDASQAAKLLRDNSLPRSEASGLDGIRKGKGMIPTAVEERAILLEALAGEVHNALNKVDGVLDVKAIVNIPEKNDLATDDKKPLPSAAVFVKYRPNLEGHAPLDEKQVKEWVAAAIEELQPQAVKVIMSPALPPPADSNPEARMQDVLGMRMTAGSVGLFKTMIGVLMGLVLLMAGVTAWTLLRGGRAKAAE